MFAPFRRNNFAVLDNAKNKSFPLSTGRRVFNAKEWNDFECLQITQELFAYVIIRQLETCYCLNLTQRRLIH